MIHAATEIHPTVMLGRNVTIWQYATICEGTEIGDDAVVGSAVWIGRDCRIGARVHINHGCFIPHAVFIGEGAFLGPCVVITDDRYPYVGKSAFGREPPVIEAGASIGAGAVILPGVRIGVGAMVGAGAVVTRDVADGEGRRGEPARLTARARQQL